MSEDRAAYDVPEGPSPAAESKNGHTSDVVPAASPVDAFKSTGFVQLPSELWVEIRRVSLTSLVLSGKVPNPLLRAGLRIADGKLEPPDADTDEEDVDEDGAEEGDEEQKRAAREQRRTEYYEALDALVMAVVIRPRLVQTEEEETTDTVWIGRLVETDKKQILYFTTIKVSGFAFFRREYASTHPGQDGAAVRSKA